MRNESLRAARELVLSLSAGGRDPRHGDDYRPPFHLRRQLRHQDGGLRHDQGGRGQAVQKVRRISSNYGFDLTLLYYAYVHTMVLLVLYILVCVSVIKVLNAD